MPTSKKPSKKAATKKRKPKQKPGTQRRLSDAKIVDMWQKREQLRARIASLRADQTKLDEAILAEFDRRGTRAIENGGHRVTRVQNETVSFNGWGIHKKLVRKRKRDVAARLVKEVIDTAALSAEVQAGNIDPDIVAEFSSISLSKPYLKGSLTGHE